MKYSNLLKRYNYDSFVPENFEPWMRFNESPPVGSVAPDFPLWDLEGSKTTLSEMLLQNNYTVIEFGSFT